ncbi:NACHT domain-containing protein, partial [Hysterangium stoloniferum]
DTQELRDRIYTWLAAPDPSNNLNAAQEQHVEGTGSWFLNSAQFTQWVATGGESLWIYGTSGCGKTILCSSIINNLQVYCGNSALNVLVYFFFDSRDSQEEFQSLHKLIRSLIKQLCGMCFDIPHPLLQIFGNGTKQVSLKAFQDVFCDLVGRFKSVYIVLDALDECWERLKLLKWLQSLLDQKLVNLHILATTRPEPSIQTKLDALGSESLSLHTTRSNHDISIYLYDRFEGMECFASLNRAFQENIFRTLNEKAGGMWVISFNCEG